jgi:hypothetical protein
MIMRKHKLFLLLFILAIIIVALIAYVSTLYLKGDVSNYEPPKPPSVTSTERVQSDLQGLSQTVDAYFIKNMEYPQKLELLQPEFLDSVACDPLSGKPYLYTLYETDGVSRYRISVPDPKLYNAREFYIEGGKLVQN